MKARLIATGTRPLLMHNGRLAAPMDTLTIEMKRLTDAKPSSKRTDDDRMAIHRIEFEGAMYHDPEIGPYMPATSIFKCLLEGARTGRRGPKIEGGVIVVEMANPLLYRGPRDIETMWDHGRGQFVDIRGVGVSGRKIDRCRPIFRDWSFEAELFVDPDVIDLTELGDIAKIAGKLKGIGDYRQLYGRFDATVEPL